jgi:RHS repeat-associated protein
MERRSSGSRAVIADALGSTRWLLALNSVDRSYSYDPDGVDSASGAGSDFDVRFAGGHRISTGGKTVYHFGARYYQPDIARWTQRDPLDQPDDLRQANPYLYAAADPVNSADPSGLLVDAPNNSGAGAFGICARYGQCGYGRNPFWQRAFAQMAGCGGGAVAGARAGALILYPGATAVGAVVGCLAGGAGGNLTMPYRSGANF